ncbi:MAG: cytosine permease, partial [Vicinamibacterales bacterium]
GRRFAVRYVVRPVDLSPVRDSDQTQSPVDLFLIFVGANIVATTLQVGASLPGALGRTPALWVIAGGSLAGAALVAALAPIGSRLRVPSIVAARAVLGFSGAQLLAGLLFFTNFAWIALNNVIAASIAVRLTGVGAVGGWATALGLLATVVVLGGPRAAAIVDRIAVPLLLVSGGVLTLACLRATWPDAPPSPALEAADVLGGFDVVAGYQATWLLMFADYPRYVRSSRAAGLAVFLGLGVTALWFMPLGLIASAVAGSSDPGAMVSALGLGWWGAVLLTVATLTTNFVNIYMSALALKSLRPATGDAMAVWLIGGVGAGLGLFSIAWIEQFASFTLLLAGALVPIGGILLAHYRLLKEPVRVPDLYDEQGRYRANGGWSLPGLIAWVGGAAAFYATRSLGGSIPALVAAVVLYVAVSRASAAQMDRSALPADPAEPSRTD